MHSRRERAGVVAGAVLATLTTWGLLRLLLGVHVHVPGMGDQPAQTLPTAHVATAAVVASLAGWASLGLLERLAGRAARGAWGVLAILVLLLSLTTPLLGAGIAAADRAALVGLHVVLAIVLVPGLARTAPPGSDAAAVAADEARPAEVGR